MGMTERQVLLRVELPLAVPLVMTGVRTAAVQVVATATLAALVGGRRPGPDHHPRLPPAGLRGGAGRRASWSRCWRWLTEVALASVSWAVTPGPRRLPVRPGAHRGGPETAAVAAPLLSRAGHREVTVVHNGLALRRRPAGVECPLRDTSRQTRVAAAPGRTGHRRRDDAYASPVKTILPSPRSPRCSPPRPAVTRAPPAPAADAAASGSRVGRRLRAGRRRPARRARGRQGPAERRQHRPGGQRGGRRGEPGAAAGAERGRRRS